MFWKAQVEKKSDAPRKLSSIIIKQVQNRMVVRLNLDDGTFIDVEGAMPRFALGEEGTVRLHGGFELSLPTTSVGAP